MKKVLFSGLVVVLLAVFSQMAFAGDQPTGDNGISNDFKVKDPDIKSITQYAQDIFEAVFNAIQNLSGQPSAKSRGDGCVTVDFELPGEIVIEDPSQVTIATGSIELYNCDDTYADIVLDGVTIIEHQIIRDTILIVSGITIGVEAGQTLSTEFDFPVPGMDATYTFCILATSGISVASDCATMTIEGEGTPGAPKTFAFVMDEEGDCVEIDLELPDTVYTGPGSVEIESGYFELTNCGDEAATIMLNVEIEMSIVDTSFVISDIPVNLGAGETISREFRFLVPPIVPSGEYGICITAVSGDAMMTT